MKCRMALPKKSEIPIGHGQSHPLPQVVLTVSNKHS